MIVAGRKYKTTRQYGMEYIECPTLRQALELGLISIIPIPKPKNPKSKKGSNAPGSMKELQLDEIILDDEDDEDDFYFQ